MTFPGVPEDVAAEIFVTTAATGVTAWTSISSDIRHSQGSPITVSGGYSSVTRSPTPSPSQCEFVINNRSGKYSPKNPLGAYYGSIGQNTPLRIASRVAKSSFSGTASNGFALPERGGAWTVVGTASRYSEGSGAGSMSFTAAAQTLLAYQAGQLYRDIDVVASFTFPFSNVTGGPIACGIALNGISTTDYFIARLNIDTAEAMVLDVVHVTPSTIDSVVTGVAVSSFAYTGQKIRIKAQLSGQQLRAKVWPAASPEPYGWLVDGSYVEGTTEGTPYADRGKGWVGLYAATGAGPTNVTFALAVDDFEARINQFHGEATSWPTEWDVSGKDCYGRVEAAGLRRRLSQGAAVLPSTYTRANVNTVPAHLLYYPVEDGTQASSIASGFPDAAPMTIYGSPQYASCSDFAPGSAPIAKVNNSSWVTPDITTPATGQIQAIFLLSVPSSGETDQVAFVQIRCTGSIGVVDCYWDAAGSGSLHYKFYDQTGVLVHTSGPMLGGLEKGIPTQISMELTQNGGNIDYVAASLKPGDSGGLVNSGTVTGHTIGAPYRLYVSPHNDVTNTAIGHISLRTSIISIYSNFAALNAYNGEGLRVRMSRLCAENDGVNFARTRSTINDQVVLGKQQQATFLALMDDAAKTDTGFLLESRDIVGLVMFTMRALYNRDPFVTLDYAAGQVQPPFRAADDDQLIINDFTASRVDGGSARVTRTTGPLALTSPTSGRGVGRYNDSESYTLPSDIYLQDMASWTVHVGTINESRYPSVNADISKLARVSTQLYLDLLGVWVGDKVEITHPKATHIASTISQIVYGYKRTFGGKHHTLELVCAPALPYTVAEIAAESGDTSPWLMRAETDGSTVNTLANAGATSLSVATPSGPLWTTTADDYPLYLDVGGIQVRATACSGASSPQTFTVDALPVARAAGLSVSVWHLPVLAQ